MRIGSREIDTSRAYIIAEAGVNHNGDIALGIKLIDAAKDAGADAVKFQTFTTEEIVTDAAAQADYQKENTGISESQASMLKKLELSRADFRQLRDHARAKNIEFLSTPFSAADADFLEELELAAYKVSSGDLTNIPFLRHLAAKKRPVLISTGMARMDEIEEAYETLQKAGAMDIIILQCTSEYPTPLSHANLAVITTLQKAFHTPIGYSDHTEGTDASVYATSLGAAVIEKHFTLDRSLPGPDHKASLSPSELKELVEKIRATARGSLSIPPAVAGTGEKVPTPEESLTAKLVRKGIFARTDISAGETLSEKNIFIARPEGMILPKEWDTVLGKRSKAPIMKGTPLSWDMVI